MLIWTPAFETCSLWLPAHFPTSAVLINALASLDWFQLFQKLHVSDLASVAAAELYFSAVMLGWNLNISWVYLLLSWLSWAFTCFWLKGVQEPAVQVQLLGMISNKKNEPCGIVYGGSPKPYQNSLRNSHDKISILWRYSFVFQNQNLCLPRRSWTSGGCSAAHCSPMWLVVPGGCALGSFVLSGEGAAGGCWSAKAEAAKPHSTLPSPVGCLTSSDRPCVLNWCWRRAPTIHKDVQCSGHHLTAGLALQVSGHLNRAEEAAGFMAVLGLTSGTATLSG